MNFHIGVLQFLVSVFLQLCTSGNRYCQEAVDSVTIVDSCPTSKAEWDDAARRKDCGIIASKQRCSTAEKFRYHCVINGYRNMTLEVCAPIRIIFGHCVEFNVPGGVIQDQRASPCSDTFPKCDSIYDSTDAYKYPDCYKYVSRNTTIYSTRSNSVATTVTTSATQTTTNESNSTDNIDLLVAIIVGVALILLIAALVLYRRRCNVGKQEVPDDEALEKINCTEDVDVQERPKTVDGLSNANNLNGINYTQGELLKDLNSAKDIQTKDSQVNKRTRTYSS